MENVEQKHNSSSSPSNSKRSMPALPWKPRLTLIVAGILADHTRRQDGSLKRRLIDMLDVKASSSPNSSTVPTHDVFVDPSRDLWFRLYLPRPATSPASLPVVVYFHGGGFAFMKPSSYNYNGFCRRLASDLPAVVLSVNYRLAPENRYPAPYDDGVDVLRFLDQGKNAGGIAALESMFRVADLSRCYLAGDSAGANIAHHVARRWTDKGASPKRVRLAGVVAIQPFFGGEGRVDSEIRLEGAPMITTSRTDWMWKAFLPEGADRDHESANVFGPQAGAAAVLGDEFPPVAVVVGGFDPLLDWQRRYVAGLQERKKDVTLIEYPDAFHTFYLFPELPLAHVVVDDIKTFVNREKTEKQDAVRNGIYGHVED